MGAALLDMRQAIVARIGELVKPVPCEPYHVLLDEDELSRAILKAPVVLVYCAGFNIGDDVSMLDVAWGACVMVSGPRPDLRGDRAAGIAEAIARHVRNADWGLPSVGRASQIHAESIYTGTLDQRAVSLWGVTWRQTIDVPADFDPSELGDFTRLCTDFDLAPGDSRPEVQGNLPLPTGG